MLSEVSQSEEENHYMVSLIGGISEMMKGIIRERMGPDWENLERETNHERLLTLGNEQRVAEGEVAGGLG